jgi:hypothetical protein
MKLRCKAGDLAVVIYAEHLHNIGLVVRVLHPYDNGDIHLPGKGFLWEVECSQKQLWVSHRRALWRNRGPVPDAYLLPLSGKTDSSQQQARQLRALPGASEG